MIHKIKKTTVFYGLFCSAFLSCTSIHADPALIPNDLLTGWNSINKSTLKNEVTFLSSDKLKGRLSLTKGDTKTISWIEQQFKRAGLTPAVGNSYLQAVPIIQPASTSNRLNLIGGHYSPDYKNTVMLADKYVGLTLDDRFDEEAALNVFFRSDQFPFVLKHVPAFWWFTGFHPDYHHITDTAEKINYSKKDYQWHFHV